MAYMKDSLGRRLDDFEVLGLAQTKTIAPPAALGWPALLPQISAVINSEFGNAGIGAGATLSPEAVFDQYSTARATPDHIWYVDAAAAGGGNGLSWGTAFTTMVAATIAANAAGGTNLVYVKAGIYQRTAGPHFGVAQTVDIAWVAYGGRVTCGTFDTYTAPSADATQTNTYSWALTNVGRVLDIRNRDRFGNPVELQPVATAAVCNRTPNSWALISGTLYVNRGDGQAVTNTNTRVVRVASTAFSLTNHVNIYLGGFEAGSGFDVFGGDIAPFTVLISSATSNRKAIVLCDSSFSFGGYVAPISAGSFSTARGVSIDGFGGIAYLARCRADANPTDGFNFHNVVGSTTFGAITVNCTAYDNGRYGQTSCNGWTSHETVTGIDIAGHYKGNHGGSCASVDSSKTWLVGTHIEDDQGDYYLGGGTLLPTAIYVRDTAQYWCEQVKITMPAGLGRAYVTLTNTAKIHRKNCQPVRQADVGPGAFDAF